MKIDVYTEFGEDIEKLWTEFEQKVIMTPFQSFAWLSHWYLTVGSPLLSVQPQIVHLHNNGHTIAILPMGIRKMFGVRILEWLGLHQTDCMGALTINNFDSNNYDKNIWELIKNNLSRFDVIHFQKHPESIVQFLYRIDFSNSSKINLKVYKATLPDSWEEYFIKIKTKIRSDSRRRRRLMEELGKVKFLCAESLEEKTEIIQYMITQKGRRYRETGVWDMFDVKEYQEFYKGLDDLSSENFKIHCSSLKVNDITVATHVGIIDESTFYHIMPADEGGKWKKYSPGRLLLLELLKWSIENNLMFFDFTIGGETYKKDWCNIETGLFDKRLAVSPRGWLYLSFLKTKSVFKKVPLFRKIVRSIRR